MRAPEVRYAKSDQVHIAYQVFGSGPVDLVLGLPWVTHLAVSWEDAPNAQFFESLAALGRLIIFDKRGVGLSDRDVGIPTVEERMDDFRAVMDAAESRRAVVVGISESSSMSLVFAAAHPERTLGLVLIGGYARTLRAPDYPWGSTLEQEEEDVRRIEREWGTPAYVDRVAADLAPSRSHDIEFKQWLARELTYGASPSSAVALERMYRDLDVRAVLPTIQAPTLVLAGDARTDIAEGKYIAERIPGAKFVELPVREHLYFATPLSTTATVAAIRDFVQGLPESVDIERVLTTVLFTDIVDSTRRASELGDQVWGRLLMNYQEQTREEVARFRGKTVKMTGDGVLATFDGPTRAVRCARALREKARGAGLDLRAGLHTGECILARGDVHGIAVHIASRVAERAGSGQILVSSTVRDLSVGSGIRFQEQEASILRGVEGEWRTYSVEDS